MGILWTNCHTCGGDLTHTEKLVEGRTVVRCARCRAYWLDGDAFVASERVMSPADVIKTLKDRAVALAADEEREKQMWDSPIDDPRWEAMT
jgi:Zn-finger nucleic acid-binding protein